MHTRTHCESQTLRPEIENTQYLVYDLYITAAPRPFPPSLITPKRGEEVVLTFKILRFLINTLNSNEIVAANAYRSTKKDFTV